MANITCSKCGTENPANAINCSNCSSNLQSPPEHPDVAEPKQDATQPTCSACESTNVSIKQVRKLPRGQLVAGLVIGSFLLVGGLFLAATKPPSGMDPRVFAFARFGCIFGGAWSLWDVLTGWPLPVLGIKLFKEERITHANCADCGSQWIVSNP